MSIDTDYAVLRDALARYVQPGWAAEFGVYSGYSLAVIAEKMPVIGFDSFEGLPEDWREGFPKGAFGDSGGALPASLAPIPNTMIVKGWFEDTARGFNFPPLSLVHIDCDLYSSTITALESVRSALRPGTVIVFDEFHGYPESADHEAKAWNEFVHRHEVSYTALLSGDQELAIRIDTVGVSP